MIVQGICEVVSVVVVQDSLQSAEKLVGMSYLVPLMAARILFINYDFKVMTINLLSVQL